MVSGIPNPEPKVSGIQNLDLRISESYQKSGVPVSIPEVVKHRSTQVSLQEQTAPMITLTLHVYMPSMHFDFKIRILLASKNVPCAYATIRDLSRESLQYERKLTILLFPHPPLPTKRPIGQTL